jgi:ketosteroid isomerase-like protein
MNDLPSSLELAQRLFAAIENGDADSVREIYAPGCEIWHNTDGATQTVDENLRTLRWVIRNIAGLRYEEARRHETPTGFVQQHVLRGAAPSGEPLEVPACIVCKVENGRITRLEEYLDSAHLAPLFRQD